MASNKKKGEEIRKEILMSLIIILIFLTIVGTWIIIDALDNRQFKSSANVQANFVYEPDESPRGGSVGITIRKPKEEGGG